MRDDADANALPVFHPAPPPSQGDVQAVEQQAAKRIVRFLQKRGLIALATATGDGQVTVVDGGPQIPKIACAQGNGDLTFTLPPVCTATTNKVASIFATTSCALPSPITVCKPCPMAKCNWASSGPGFAPDGTIAVVLAPHAFIGRLAAIIPPPRRHVTRNFGVPSSHSALRAANCKGDLRLIAIINCRHGLATFATGRCPGTCSALHELSRLGKLIILRFALPL